MSKNFVPKISVIIPMYNSEKYIGECLESVLTQTFQDFEIIVVDNCSTDKSCEVVENYVKNFANKIKLVRRKFNSGGCSEPRNDGVKISSGKYIFFMDSDDMIIKTALEELYNVAENFNAEIVTCEKFYAFNDNQSIYESKISSYQHNRNFVTEPTLDEGNFEQRVKDLLNRKTIWNVWCKLYLRKFIVENNIKMVSRQAEDLTFTIATFCIAKKLVRVPNIVNLYRVHENSVTTKKDSPIETLKKWIRFTFESCEYLEKFFGRQENFKNRTDLKYLIFETLMRLCIEHTIHMYPQINEKDFEKIVRGELEKIKNKTTVATSWLYRIYAFNIILFQQQNFIIQLQTENRNLKEQLQK